jgi:hypothetical protein
MGVRASRVVLGAALFGLGITVVASGTSSAQPAPVARGKASFCASFVKGVPPFGHPVALTHDHGATLYKDKQEKDSFYVCDEKSKSSSGGETVDGAKGFTVEKFSADKRGHAALAFVDMKGNPTYEGVAVTPLMVTLYHLAPHGRSDHVIVANLTGSVGKTAFSSNGWSAWAEGDPSSGFSITVADTANTKAMDDPNYLPGGVRTTDAAGWSLQAQGKDVVLHYTNADGAAATALFPYTFTPPNQ